MIDEGKCLACGFVGDQKSVDHRCSVDPQAWIPGTEIPTSRFCEKCRMVIKGSGQCGCDVTIGKVTISWGPVSPPILKEPRLTMRGFVGDVVFFFEGGAAVGLDLYRDWVKEHGTLKPGEWFAEVKECR